MKKIPLRKARLLEEFPPNKYVIRDSRGRVVERGIICKHCGFRLLMKCGGRKEAQRGE